MTTHGRPTWRAALLGDIADVRAGCAFPHAEQGQRTGEYPFYKVSDMNSPGNEARMTAANNWVQAAAVTRLKAKLFPADTIIFPKVGAALHTNKKRLLSVPALIDNNLMGVVPRAGAECDPEFLLYWFQRLDLATISQPGPLPSITAGAVKQVQVDLPSLGEQKEIARALSAVQAAIDARRQEVEREQERRAELTAYLFRCGLRDEQRKSTDLGEIPASWEVVPLGAVIVEGPQNGLYKPASCYGRGTPIIRINDFDNEGRFYRMEFQRVQLDAIEQTRYAVRDGDILVNRVNSLSHLGKCILMPSFGEITVFESNMMRIRVDETAVLPAFVTRNLTRPEIRTVIRGKAKRAVAQSSINQADLRSLPLPKPSLDEQRNMMALLSACDEKIEALERETEVLDHLFQAVLDGLLTGRLVVDSPRS